MPHDIDINQYDYELPEERIAKYPLPQRDTSNLLVYQAGQIQHRPFHELVEELPSGALLVFNNTRVIHARLKFTLPSGRPLEILCLEPLAPLDYQQNLSSCDTVEWKCLVGGNRKWKSGEIATTIETPSGSVALQAKREERLDGPFRISFRWNAPDISFGELLAAGGIIPLPPYLNRASESSDQDRYQTVYAQPEGSVAAPTAGLHFTEDVFTSLDQKGIQRAFVTLHVGAGTFKPVTTDKLSEHEMHRESIFVHRSLIDQLVDTLEHAAPIIAVGTTSMRTLESLYWLGSRLVRQLPMEEEGFTIGQWEPYELPPEQQPTPLAALQALKTYLHSEQKDLLEGYTQLLIAPGYPSRLVDGIITNFHQPRSTLLLLIASLIGEDWRSTYAYAMQHDFRFLSYGDSSLLWRTESERPPS
ncbi:MAG: S-adenosylmethionine:tRNA ribosyltransferase-isomerase [Bacteroidota bacterium]